MTRRLFLAFLLIAPAVAAQQAPRPTRTRAKPPAVTGSRPVDVFLDLLNDERFRRGLPAVTLDPMLTRYSYYNSLESAARGEPGHFVMPPDWKRQNSAQAPQGVEQAFRVWMNSVPHQAGMMDPDIRWVGIAWHESYWTFTAND